MPKCLHNNDNSEKHNNFFNHFFHDESVSFAVRNYFWSCDLSNPNNFVIVFFLFVQQIKTSDSQYKGHVYVLERFKCIFW